MTEETTMVNAHEEIVKQYEVYIAENTKFTDKGVKAAAGRARKALQEMTKAIKQRRKDITEAKATLTAK
jgi:hypothetical protein